MTSFLPSLVNFRICWQIVVDDPDVLLGIVRIDLDLMRAAAAVPQLVPLRPRLDQPSGGVDDVDAVLKARLPLRRLPAGNAPRTLEVGSRIGREGKDAPLKHEHAVG